MKPGCADVDNMDTDAFREIQRIIGSEMLGVSVAVQDQSTDKKVLCAGG